MSTSLDLGIPASSSTVTVRAIDVSPGATVPAAFLTSPVLPGREAMIFPCYAFLIDHAPDDKRLMFDLGPRKDLQSLAPAIAESLQAASGAKFETEKDITERLIEGGIPLESIQPSSGGELFSFISGEHGVLMSFTCPVTLTLTTLVRIQTRIQGSYGVFSLNLLTGDMSKFPPSTELLAGPGFDRKGYPTHPDAKLLDSDLS